MMSLDCKVNLLNKNMFLNVLIPRFCILNRAKYKLVNLCIGFNPIDPNPAISAHVVYPQSGHIRPEKRPFFRNFQHFFQIRTINKVLTAYKVPIYQIKAHKPLFEMQQKLFSFD